MSVLYLMGRMSYLGMFDRLCACMYHLYALLTRRFRNVRFVAFVPRRGAKCPKCPICPICGFYDRLTAWGGMSELIWLLTRRFRNVRFVRIPSGDVRFALLCPIYHDIVWQKAKCPFWVKWHKKAPFRVLCPTFGYFVLFGTLCVNRPHLAHIGRFLTNRLFWLLCIALS